MPADDSLMCTPKFVRELSDLTVTDGESLTLTCTVSGDPEPQVTWHKDKKVSNTFLSKIITIL